MNGYLLFGGIFYEYLGPLLYKNIERYIIQAYLVHPWNSKDISLYWQKSAQFDGLISWNSMTHLFYLERKDPGCCYGRILRGRPLIIWGGGANRKKNSFGGMQKKNKTNRECPKKKFVRENPHHAPQMINGQPLRDKMFAFLFVYSSIRKTQKVSYQVSHHFKIISWWFHFMSMQAPILQNGLEEMKHL